jgi:CheY-like chemotaxis protein
MDETNSSEPLVAFDHVLDRLLSQLQAEETERLDGAVRGYVEDAIEAAMAAAGRARDNGLEGSAAGQIREAVVVARALLEELRASSVRFWALVDRSLELRRQAIRLTATALTLRRQSERRHAADRSPASSPRPTPGTAVHDRAAALHAVRILLVGDSPAHEDEFTMLLAALGADVRASRSLPAAVEVALTFHPDVLVCDVPFPAAEGLICELRRQGVIAPALAAAAADDTGTRGAARAAGFTGVIMRPVSLSVLARTVRAALGA